MEFYLQSLKQKSITNQLILKRAVKLYKQFREKKGKENEVFS